ncbi:hypothetical protein KSP40_PGU003349 [Platanthera guangdongensis]|uniref:DUF4378 domain-containing protein n=1 Tax=Platanthera guangdongensis TaxID=2320717 RepID=A0ABR2LT56_9ASPA
MGLDELHPQVVSEFKSETEHSLLKRSSAGLEVKFECSGRHSFHVNRRKQQNFRTVHDLCDSSNAKKHTDHVVPKEKGYSKRDMDFIKQQFLEAKRLSTDEALQKTKEFNDALNILDSNKEIFLKFLQEPNPLFAKHFHGLKHSNSSSHSSHFKIFESSACNNKRNSEAYYRTAEENNGYTRKMKDTAHGCANPNASIGNCSTYDNPDSLLLKSLSSQCAGKKKTSSHPTSIVVLKPAVQKVQSTGRTSSCPRSLPNYKDSCRRQREVHRELLVEREEQHGLFHVKTKECKTKDTTGIARDILEKTMQPLRRYSAEVLASRIDIQNSSSSFLSEPSLSRKAMNGLLWPWKMSGPSRQGLIGEGSTTLGEMLSLSDKEALQTRGQLSFKNLSDKIVEKENLHDSRDYTSGISGSDGWKDECESFLPKYENHRVSLALYESSKHENKHEVDCVKSIDDCNMLKDKCNLGQNDLSNSITDRRHSLVRNFKYCDNNPWVFRSRGEENIKPVKEVKVCQNASKNMINLNNLIEPMPVYLQRNINELLHLVHNSSNSKDFHSEKSFLSYLKEFQQSVKDKDLLVVLENEIPEVASIDFPLVECHMNVITESGALIVPKVSERLSPVSVLDPPSKDGKSTPGCLERINAGLQDLRRQLNLLELETVGSGDEQSKPLIFNDETGKEILMLLKHGGGRDLLYLLDILTVSGIYASTQNKFFDACYLSDSPVFPDVFEKLEKKYNTVTLWSRSERKLLFDHINSVLAKVLAPCMDLHPWVELKSNIFCGHGRLVNESWRVLIRRQKELSKGKPEDMVLDSRWLYLDDHVDMIGREIEIMVKDDLLDELISEFFE